MERDAGFAATRRTWISAGLDALQESGPSGVTIAALTIKAGLTRGSFYHHFSSQKEFTGCMLEAWGRRGEINTEPGAAPFDAFHPALERAIRSLDGAEPFIAKVDESRISRLSEIWGGEGNPLSRRYATLLYAAWLGAIAMPGQDDEMRRKNLALMAELIAAHWYE